MRPLPRLSERWLAAADDGSAELRLASALASARAPVRAGKLDVLGPIRAHALPLSLPRFDRFASSEEGLRDDPRVVWTGSDFVQDLSRVVLRRAMESTRDAFDGLALEGTRFATLGDISLFIAGALDDGRIGRLARGLMSLERSAEAEPRPGRPMPLYALFRVASLDASDATRRVRPDVVPRCDGQTLRLLAAGRLDEATRLAVRRLGAMGLRPKLRVAAGAPPLAARLLASLAFPIGPRAVSAALDAVTKPLDLQATETP